jgi:hypothetical protein
LFSPVNFSRAPGTTKTFLRVDNPAPGPKPFYRPSPSTNGLNAEPGWRRPCVARLNGERL